MPIVSFAKHSSLAKLNNLLVDIFLRVVKQGILESWIIVNLLQFPEYPAKHNQHETVSVWISFPCNLQGDYISSLLFVGFEFALRQIDHTQTHIHLWTLSSLRRWQLMLFDQEFLDLGLQLFKSVLLHDEIIKLYSYFFYFIFAPSLSKVNRPSHPTTVALYPAIPCTRVEKSLSYPNLLRHFKDLSGFDLFPGDWYNPIQSQLLGLWPASWPASFHLRGQTIAPLNITACAEQRESDREGFPEDIPQLLREKNERRAGKRKRKGV